MMNWHLEKGRKRYRNGKRRTKLSEPSQKEEINSKIRESLRKKTNRLEMRIVTDYLPGMREDPKHELTRYKALIVYNELCMSI